MDQNFIRYKTSYEKIIIALAIAYLIFVLTNFGTGLADTLKGDFVVFAGIIILIIIGLKYSYVEIHDGDLKYVNMLVERKTIPITNIIRLGYPRQNWIALYSYMYVLYDDPKQPGKDKYMKIIRGQFDEKTLSKIASDLKRINPDIEIEKELTY